jgi:hypothetical protein
VRRIRGKNLKNQDAWTVFFLYGIFAKVNEHAADCALCTAASSEKLMVAMPDEVLIL